MKSYTEGRIAFIVTFLRAGCHTFHLNPFLDGENNMVIPVTCAPWWGTPAASGITGGSPIHRREEHPRSRANGRT